jgi:RNA polymerase sigma-70 factor (ECF subfamily)
VASAPMAACSVSACAEAAALDLATQASFVDGGSHGISHDEERALVARAQAGETAAFHEMYERYAGQVHRYAILPLVHDRALGEDLLADTFVRALENIGRVRWQGKGVLPWLIRIAKNLCLDHLRKSGRVGSWPVELDQLVPDPTGFDGETLVAHVEITDLMRERIDACLEDINPRYRKVLQLRLVAGMPRDLAAARMDVSIGTLDVLLFRACKAFRKVYVQRYGSRPQREFDPS